MAIDQTINRLVIDLAPTPRRSIGREAALLAAIGLAELGVYLLAGAARPDLVSAAALPMLWWKVASLFLIAVLGTATALASFSPERSPRIGLGGTAAAIGLALLVGLVLTWRYPIAGGVLDRLDFPHGLMCLWKMTALSLPPTVALGVLARRGGSTHPGGTALACGIGAGGWGAFVFAFACPSDDPFYIMCWYLVGCGGVAVITRVLLGRLLRW